MGVLGQVASPLWLLHSCWRVLGVFGRLACSHESYTFLTGVWALGCAGAQAYAELVTVVIV